MLIRSTPHACFVILNNGLTLELFYDESLTGTRNTATPDSAGHMPTNRQSASQGVWLMGEEVLVEVSAGQA